MGGVCPVSERRWSAIDGGAGVDVAEVLVLDDGGALKQFELHVDLAAVGVGDIGGELRRGGCRDERAPAADRGADTRVRRRGWVEL